MLFHLGQKVTLFQCFGYVFTEIYFSAITPSSMGGQPVQMYEMKRDHIGYQITSVVVLLNTMIYKIALILLATIAFLVYHDVLFPMNSFFRWVVVIGYITTILVIFLFGVLVYSKTLVKWFQKLLAWFIEHLGFIKKKEENIKKLDQTVKEYQQCAILTKKKPIILLESFGILLLQRISILSISYFVYRSFGLNTYTIGELIAFQICITLGSDLMPTPGGVMINEGLSLTANTFLFGESLALSSMVLGRSISFYFLVIISAMGYLIFHLRKRNEE